MITILYTVGAIIQCIIPLSSSPKLDSSNTEYYAFIWIAFTFSFLLLVPGFYLCKWLGKDTSQTRKKMENSFLAIILLNLLRYIWIMAGSWILFGNSIDWYLITKMRDVGKEKNADILRDRVNDRFVTRFVLELVILTLIYWYFWQVSQRYSKVCQRRSQEAAAAVAARDAPDALGAPAAGR